jgi:hypothetical protein
VGASAVLGLQSLWSTLLDDVHRAARGKTASAATGHSRGHDSGADRPGASGCGDIGPGRCHGCCAGHQSRAEARNDGVTSIQDQRPVSIGGRMPHHLLPPEDDEDPEDDDFDEDEDEVEDEDEEEEEEGWQVA